MPHCGHHDDDVEVLYAQCSQILKEERKLGHRVVFGGDWNAEVPSDQISGHGKAVGPFGNEVGNAR
eukprot:1993175-Karenia_brevis.AAC.1